jgi:hypothetical protein
MNSRAMMDARDRSRLVRRIPDDGARMGAISQAQMPCGLMKKTV